jgi:hypothetical protein
MVQFTFEIPDSSWRRIKYTVFVENEHIGNVKIEGLVLCVADSFTLPEFSTYCAKGVRKNHVQTDKHWMRSAITPNGLAQRASNNLSGHF